MEEEKTIIFRWKNGRIIPIYVDKLTIQKKNEYMNQKIRNNITKKENAKEYKKYDDDEQGFIQNNPDVILSERNEIIDEWTSDVGGYHSNGGITKYMREDRERYPHVGWEQGIKDLDNQIKGKLSEDIVTYRTTQIPVKNLEVGQMIDNDTFIATSISRSESYSAHNHGDAYSSTIEVDVEKGTRCLYIGGNTGFQRNEQELLFPPEYGIQITLVKKEYDDDGDYMRTLIKGKMVKK